MGIGSAFDLGALVVLGRPSMTYSEGLRLGLGLGLGLGLRLGTGLGLGLGIGLGKGLGLEQFFERRSGDRTRVDGFVTSRRLGLGLGIGLGD